MRALFHDRHDAGRQLGAQLASRSYPAPIVLGLPRGGVPVAFEVARALHAPLDIFVVRKLGVPGHEELAMGAIASGNVRVLVPDVVSMLGIPNESIERITTFERAELARREREFRGNRPFPSLAGMTVILVDDGVATGASMSAAVRAIRELHAVGVVTAAPVMSRQAYDTLRSMADACEAVSLPDPFYGVGAWYEDFTQTTDDEVRALLDAYADGAPARVAATEPVVTSAGRP